MKKNYFYNVLLSLTNVLFPVISFPYASRILGPVGIGKVQIVVSFAQYFALIASFGIPIYGIQQIAKVKKNKALLNKTFSELMLLSFIVGIIITVIYFLVISFFSYYHENYKLYAYASVLIILGFINFDWLYSGLEEFKSISLRSVLIKTVSLFFLYFFVRRETDYPCYLFITLFAILGNYLIGIVMLKNKITFTWCNLHINGHIKPLAFILSTTVVASLYTMFDTVLLGFLSDEASVGYYTAANKLTKITLPFITAFGVIIIPRISQNFADKQLHIVEDLIRKSFEVIVFLSVPITIGLILLSPEFINVFSGWKFFRSVKSMEILSFLPFLIGIGHLFVFQILVPAGKNKEMLYAAIGGVIVFLIMNFALVPYLHEVGAALANVATELTVTALYYYFLKKYFSLFFQWKIIYQSLFCSIFFFPLIGLLRLFVGNDILVLLLSVFLCGVSYFLMQFFLFKNTIVSRSLLVAKMNSVS